LTPYRAEFLILCLLVLVHFQARVLELSLAAHMLQRFSVGAMAAVAIVKLLAYGLLASAGALTLDKALLADTAAFAVAYLLMLVAYRRRCAPTSLPAWYRPDPKERRRLLRYGAYNNFNDAGTLFLDSKTDNFFIAAIIDPVSVGIYAFYTRLNEMGQNMLPARLFQNVIQPLFFSIPVEQADRKVPQYFSLLVNLNLAWHLPVLAYAMAYHAEIVQVIFGGKFAEVSWMLPVIVGFATCNVVEWPVTLVAQYEEKAATMLISKVFALYNVAALLLLIPAVGVVGAAIASGSAQWMKYVFIWWRVRRLGRWTNARVAIATSSALWGAVVLVCLFLKHLLADRALLHLGVGIVVVGMGTLAHLRGPALSEVDRQILSTVLAGREATLLRRLGLVKRLPTDQQRADPG
jgi:O-antigen/teichoic acid export membrane protein